MSEHAEWETRLGRMKQAVEVWMERTSGDEARPPSAEPGSSLAGDDRLFPEHPVSSVAWHGLITAVEHLDFTLSAMAATGTLYPSAYFTTLRAALLGASQAVWVLAPASRRERQERALTAAKANYEEQKKAYGAVPTTTPEQQVLVAQAKARLDTRIGEVTAAAVSLGVDPVKASRLKLNATEVIELAAAQTVPGTMEQAYAMFLWRTASGHVHGHPYTRLLQLRSDHVVEEPDGRLWARHTSNVVEIGTAASAVVLITNKAWAIFDQRRISQR
ncbi:hypothetical protein ACWEPB_22105 [Kitasatospora cineracea]